MAPDGRRSEDFQHHALFLVRELDEPEGFGELLEQYLTDSRVRNTQLYFANLLRQLRGWRATSCPQENAGEENCSCKS